MKIDNNILEKLEKLSFIKVEDAKRDEFIKSLDDILSFMECLNKVDTTNVSIIDELKCPLREDEVIPSNIKDAVLKAAPNATNGYFIVPKIIE